MKSWLQRIIKIGWGLLLLALAGSSFLSAFSLDEVQPFSHSLVTLLISLAGIVFYLLVAFGGQKSEQAAEPGSPARTARSGWRAYFLAVFVCAGTILVVNPRGLYGIKLFPQLSNAIKQEKVQYYRQLEDDPEVIILGSSRALTLSPAYIQETLGYATYNFGISGVTQNELALQAEMISAQRVVELPKVVVYEVSPSSLQPLSEANLSSIPIEFLPYMSSRQGAGFLLDRVVNLFSGYQFSEAVYVLQFTKQERTPQNYWEVRPDGSSQFFPKETLDEALTRQLEQRAAQNQTPCRNYAKDGDKVIRDFAALAAENQFSVVYYFSPIHPQFKEGYLDKSPDYPWCLDIFYTLMDTLADENPGIFFVDLSDPAMAGLSANDSGFYDGFHITPASAELVIDMLGPAIRSAYDAAADMRGGQP